MARTEMLERINLDFATLRVSDSDELFKSWPAKTSWSQCMDMYVCEHIYIYIYLKDTAVNAHVKKQQGKGNGPALAGVPGSGSIAKV